MTFAGLFRAPAMGAAMAFALLPGVGYAEPFNGPYAGVQAGLGILHKEGSILTGPVDETDESAVASAVLGYRMPVGQSPVVIGVEGDAGIYSEGTNARYGVSGIGGVKIAERGLIYGRVGYAWLDGIPVGAKEGIDGLVLGGGGEIALTDTISARADYKYLNYGGVNFPDLTLDFEGHEITASVLINF